MSLKKKSSHKKPEPAARKKIVKKAVARKKALPKKAVPARKKPAPKLIARKKSIPSFSKQVDVFEEETWIDLPTSEEVEGEQEGDEVIDDGQFEIDTSFI